MPATRPLKDRLLDKIEYEPNTGCWLWFGGCNERGYGIMGYGSRGNGVAKAHRVSWEVHNNEHPGDMKVLHKCDTPACVNPAHLFLGTLKDNSQDCVRKGRNFVPDNSGENAKWAKLTREQARDIKTRRMTAKNFAALYGVSVSTVTMIWAGKNWPSA